MKRLTILFVLLTSTGACASRTVNQPQFGIAPVEVASTLIVERFLQAANARDLNTMSRLFGTEDGLFADRRSRTEVELQMDALSEILRHDRYEMVSERRVAGAEAPSTRFGVDLLLPGGVTMVRDVGFTVVLESPNRWLVSLIEVDKVTETENASNRNDSNRNDSNRND